MEQSPAKFPAPFAQTGARGLAFGSSRGDPSPSQGSFGMLSKTARAVDPASLPAAKRLRHNIQDAVAGNILPASRGVEMLQDAAAAGSSDCAWHQRPGTTAKNAARDIRRFMLRTNTWPGDYIAQVRVRSPQTQLVEQQDVHLLLPHEVLGRLSEASAPEALLQCAGLDPVSLQHLQFAEGEVGQRLVPLGLWADGCPCNWDRTESLEVISLNLPGQRGEFRALRVPVTGLSSKNVAAGATFPDLLEVVRWSLECCILGQYPSARHDGQDWQASDRVRAKRAGQPLGCRAVLVEVRGDWKLMAQVYNLPYWNAADGICWRCTCTRAEIREVSSLARWRSEPLPMAGLLQRIRNQGKQVSPLFGAPFITSAQFRFDWLHAVDLGCAADFLGNVLSLCLRKLPGDVAARVRALWAMIQTFYTENGTTDRLQDLTITMVEPKKGPPKLRGSAAQVRSLVPFGEQVSALLLVGDGEEEAARVGARLLHDCYRSLSSTAPNRQALLQASANAFAAQWVALERVSTSHTRWRVKPKLHLLLEIAREGSDPALVWTYRDEDWGGMAARLSRRRGGPLRPRLTSSKMICNFRLKTTLPRLP